ncbi:MAG: hypothetical protein C0505_19345 [Leptothrix sp. (in: Bacteria)]|nr:hypothetical protein [Leptothrix sp. (in: b-proteobacteria)]
MTPPQGGAASGAAKPVPPRRLEGGIAALAGSPLAARRRAFSLQLWLPPGRPVRGSGVTGS